MPTEQVYFTADLHLGHKNIIDHCNRPHYNVQTMNLALIDNINNKVTTSDRLYILGDFSFHGGIEATKLFRSQIKCKNVYLLRGNHDRLSAKQYEQAGFIFKGELANVEVENQHITLCHYAMRRWPGSHRGAWHLYGHSHGKLPDDPKSLSFDIGVDCNGYAPLSFDEVRTKMYALKGRVINEVLTEELAS